MALTQIVAPKKGTERQVADVMKNPKQKWNPQNHNHAARAKAIFEETGGDRAKTNQILAEEFKDKGVFIWLHRQMIFSSDLEAFQQPQTQEFPDFLSDLEPPAPKKTVPKLDIIHKTAYSLSKLKHNKRRLIF